MLTKDQKIELVKKITEKISDSKSLVVCDYKGLTVAEINELRDSLRKEGAQMQVIKKTLLQIALKEVGIEMDVRGAEGQIAIIYSSKDEIVSPKLTHEFSKDHENLKILKGVLEDKELTDKEVVALAKLPSREELLAKVVGSIKAPVSGLVNVLGGNLRGLVAVLNSIKESKN